MPITLSITLILTELSFIIASSPSFAVMFPFFVIKCLRNGNGDKILSLFQESTMTETIKGFEESMGDIFISENKVVKEKEKSEDGKTPQAKNDKK